MKLWILFSSLILTVTSVVAEVPTCPYVPPSNTVTLEDEFCKIIQIKGSEAEEKYRALNQPEVPPRPNTYPQDYMLHAVITAKYSRELICWKIQAPVYRLVDGQKQYVGPEACVQFSCNIIEHKQQ